MKKLLLCAVAALSLVSGSLLAAPVVQIKGGMTTLILNEDTLGLLENCDVERIKPAVQRPDGTRWRFMVSGGVLDQETYVGELEHSGGVSISCGEEQGESASIQNLRAEYIEGELVLTAVVVIGEEPLRRLPLFAPGGDSLESSVSNGGVIRLAGIELSLTQAAAEFLNGLLLTTEFSEQTVIGEAIARIKVRPSASRGKGNGNGNGNGNNKNKNDDEDEDEDEEEEEEEEGS